MTYGGTNPMIARLHFVQNVLKIQQNPSNILYWGFFPQHFIYHSHPKIKFKRQLIFISLLTWINNKISVLYLQIKFIISN